MTPHNALYQAICASPDEDTPRLVFADLLEEEGELVRAAFIRAQIELASVPEYDALWAKCRQFDPGVIRGWAMAHTLPRPLPNGFSWHRHRFRRGFPWLATALGTEPFVEHAEALLAIAPIQALTFDDRSRPDLTLLANCPHLRQLRCLEFSSSRLGSDDLAAFVVSPYANQLTHLVLETDAVTVDGLETLAGSELFSRLESLHLERNVIPPALLVDALGAATVPGQLRSLSLPYSDLYPADAATLWSLPLMRGLDHLDLRDNRHLGAEGLESLVEHGVLQGLRILNLASTYPGVPGVRALTSTSGLAGVRWLDLSSNRLGPVAIRTLAESERTRGLRVLNLDNNPIGDKGTVALAESRHLAGLVELELADCGVGDAGAIALAESPHLDGLIRLDIRDRTISRPLSVEARKLLIERFGPRVSFNTD